MAQADSTLKCYIHWVHINDLLAHKEVPYKTYLDADEDNLDAYVNLEMHLQDIWIKPNSIVSLSPRKEGKLEAHLLSDDEPQQSVTPNGLILRRIHQRVPQHLCVPSTITHARLNEVRTHIAKAGVIVGACNTTAASSQCRECALGKPLLDDSELSSYSICDLLHSIAFT